MDLTSFRLRHGAITTRQLAAMLDVDPATISRWANGAPMPGGYQLVLELIDRGMVGVAAVYAVAAEIAAAKAREGVR